MMRAIHLHHLPELLLTHPTATRATTPAASLQQSFCDQPPPNRVVAHPDAMIRPQLLGQQGRTKSTVNRSIQLQSLVLLALSDLPDAGLAARTMHQALVSLRQVSQVRPMHLSQRQSQHEGSSRPRQLLVLHPAEHHQPLPFLPIHHQLLHPSLLHTSSDGDTFIASGW